MATTFYVIKYNTSENFFQIIFSFSNALQLQQFAYFPDYYCIMINRDYHIFSDNVFLTIQLLFVTLPFILITSTVCNIY